MDVTVVSPAGASATSASDQFSYVTGPAVTGISPTSGPVVGDTSVTITGWGFAGVTGVKFGTAAATGFTVKSATQIMATSPAGVGTVDVTVVTADGTSTTSSVDKFTYLAAPTALVTTPTNPQSGNVTISYSLADPESDFCSVLVQYSINGGTSWSTATAGTGGDGTSNLGSSTGGTQHKFVWNSVRTWGARTTRT